MAVVGPRRSGARETERATREGETTMQGRRVRSVGRLKRTINTSAALGIDGDIGGEMHHRLSSWSFLVAEDMPVWYVEGDAN